MFDENRLMKEIGRTRDIEGSCRSALRSWKTSQLAGTCYMAKDHSGLQEIAIGAFTSIFNLETRWMTC